MINKLDGLFVKCTTCGKIRHKTTEHYRPDQTPKGNFLELIDPWKKWRWNCYDDEGENTSTTSSVMMTCPGCSAPLVKNGRLTIVKDVKSRAAMNQEAMKGFEEDEVPEPIEPIPDIEPVNELTCKVCGKECKSALGLLSHSRMHKDKDKTSGND